MIERLSRIERDTRSLELKDGLGRFCKGSTLADSFYNYAVKNHEDNLPEAQARRAKDFSRSLERALDLDLINPWERTLILLTAWQVKTIFHTDDRIKYTEATLREYGAL